jgi:chemotaxis protein CheD
MSETREIHVTIGEVKTGRKGKRLRALLGSCVGIAIIWRARGISALAHCLLAESPTKLNTIGGRFVSQAIPSMLLLMRARPEDYGELVAVVAGGGNMTVPNAKNPNELVGSVNARTALRCLADLKIRVIHEDLGGEVGRTITVDCETGNFEIQHLSRIVAA